MAVPKTWYFLAVFLYYASWGCTHITSAKEGTLTQPLTELLMQSKTFIAQLINETVQSQILSGFCRLPNSKVELAFEPDTKYNASGLISSKGYPVQNYEVPTKDGFLLGMERIPHGKNNSHMTGPRPAVLLQHGLLAASTIWVSNSANESLGFILADAGYDVWLGNARGNTYSKKHQHLKETQREFWYWSWDEMAKYDLPALVDFVLKTTGQKTISYIGHSQGTTMAFAGLSNNKDLQSKVNLFIALGPVTNSSHMTSPIRKLFYPDIYIPLVATLDLLRQYEFLPHTVLDSIWSNTICDYEPTVAVCQSVMYILGGYSCQHMNASRIPVYTSNCPAGTSIWNIEHWAQVTHNGNFAMFDYGSDGNMEHYGQTTPPLYNVTEIDVPVALFYGSDDILADPVDVEELIPHLKNIVYKHKIDTYGHLDFIWAVDAAGFVYKDVLKLLKEVGV